MGLWNAKLFHRAMSIVDPPLASAKDDRGACSRVPIQACLNFARLWIEFSVSEGTACAVRSTVPVMMNFEVERSHAINAPLSIENSRCTVHKRVVCNKRLTR